MSLVVVVENDRRKEAVRCRNRETFVFCAVPITASDLALICIESRRATQATRGTMVETTKKVRLS